MADPQCHLAVGRILSSRRMATPIVGAVFKSGSRRMKQGGCRELWSLRSFLFGWHVSSISVKHVLTRAVASTPLNLFHLHWQHAHDHFNWTCASMTPIHQDLVPCPSKCLGFGIVIGGMLYIYSYKVSMLCLSF